MTGREDADDRGQTRDDDDEKSRVRDEADGGEGER